MPEPQRLAVEERLKFRTCSLTFLTLFALAPRLLGTICLPNAFGDAYAYSEQIYYLRRAILDGTVSSSNVFGFWLPLYQAFCSLISTVTGAPFYIARLVPAVCGAGLCVFVFLVTRRLTISLRWSLTAFFLISLNPYHILYSSSAMTDVPHAFVVLVCAFCCIRDRWAAASCLACAATLIRIESWVLVPLLPMLEYARTRRVSSSTILIPAIGPAAWLLISWTATGDWWSYFEIRNEYIVQSMAVAPQLQHLTAGRLAVDLVRLIYTANPIILASCLGALGALIWKWRSFDVKSRPTLSDDELLLVFFVANFSFLALAYISGNQPDIWPRYGLILFALGLPLLLARLARSVAFPVANPSWRRSAIVALFAIQFGAQLIDSARITLRRDPHRAVARFLSAEHLIDRTAPIYCDDSAARVLSGIPLEEFIDQYHSPPDKEAFARLLEEKGVRFLVSDPSSTTKAGRFIGEIEGQPGRISLEPLLPRRGEASGGEIKLYRVHQQEVSHSIMRW